MEYVVFFVLLGCVLGTFGTLVGTGGGFILVPILLWLYPETDPASITSISLAVVSVNSLSGVLAYGRMDRIDYRSGVVFIAATIPGAILGALSTSYLPRGMFDMAIGILLVVACLLLLMRPASKVEASSNEPPANTRRNERSTASVPQQSHQRLILGAVLSFGIALVSSALGISGGIFQVPMMVYFLGFPVHIAVATSEFVLALKGLAATSVHVLTGTIFAYLSPIATLSIGVFIGAQVGAWLSNHVQGIWIMRMLALSIGYIGITFLVTGLPF